MAKHLTDRQKKRIIADYAALENYSAVARKYKVSVDTVKRVVLRDPKTAEKTRQKRDENTADILEYMEKQKDDVCNLIGLYVKALQDPDRLKRASVQSIATSLGIIIDKFTKVPTEIDKANAEIARLRDEKPPAAVHPLIVDIAAAIQSKGSEDEG